MATKAARGAGVPLGHAEDFGPVVAYMAAQDPIGLTCLQAALERHSNEIDLQSAGDYTTIKAAQVIIAAPIAIDVVKAGGGKVRLLEVDATALLIAYCKLAEGVICETGDDGYVISPAEPAAFSNVAQACDFPDDIWDVLAAFAAHTYVPATEASRLSGAGAGLTDND